MGEAVPGFEWAEYVKLKERIERNRVQSKECNRVKRFEKKVADGLDPNIDRRANQRDGESDEDYAERTKKNAEKARWRRQREQAKRDGAWVPRKKLTPEEKKAKNAARVKAWRLAKRQR